MNITARRSRNGHTLVEMILVVIIIGMLAAIIVPGYQRQSKRTAINATKTNIETLRTAIAVYYESEGTYPTGDLSGLISAPSGAKYLGAIPFEAISNKNSVTNVPDYQGGWFYNQTTHLIYVNLTGGDMEGTPYSAY